MQINKVAFIGKGGVGLLYGSMIARALGNDAVEYVMDDARFERHANDALTVNGKPCEIQTIDDCFMAIPVEPGENQIQLHFVPRGFHFALGITIAGTLAAVGYLVIRRIRRKKPPFAPEWMCRLMQAVFWCVLVVFYACTMIINIF